MKTAQLNEAVRAARKHLPPSARPGVALVLGSGLGTVADAFGVRTTVPYTRIPHLGATGVQGHAGRMILSKDGSTLIFQGRRHRYEGAGWEPVAIPVRIARELGVRVMLLTNAAGGLRPGFRPGDLMLIEDHIHLMGANPLEGPHDPFWGPRFPDQTRVYDARLNALLTRTARRLGFALRRGIYLAVTGPAYETPAEIRAYRRLGADAIGMSTTPEATLAHAAGLRVAALSSITNLAAGLSRRPLSHDDVIRENSRTQQRLARLLTCFVAAMAPELES